LADTRHIACSLLKSVVQLYLVRSLILFRFVSIRFNFLFEILTPNSSTSFTMSDSESSDTDGEVTIMEDFPSSGLSPEEEIKALEAELAALEEEERSVLQLEQKFLPSNSPRMGKCLFLSCLS